MEPSSSDGVTEVLLPITVNRNEGDGTISDVCVALETSEPTQTVVSAVLQVVDNFKSGELHIAWTLILLKLHCVPLIETYTRN